MDSEDFKKFKIKIDYKYDVPIRPKNPYTEYKKQEDKKSKKLYVEIFFDEKKIGIGIILGFYKDFEIRESDWGNLYTYPLHRTKLGNKIYKIKFYTNPKLSDTLKEQYIDSFVKHFEKPLDTLKNKLEKSGQNLCITYIPSSTKTPDIVASKLADKFDIQLEQIISKDGALGDSKNVDNYFDSMQHSQKKYKFDEKFINANKDLRYLVIDDVFGLGSSMLTTLKKLHDITQKVNFFFTVVKDTKR